MVLSRDAASGALAVLNTVFGGSGGVPWLRSPGDLEAAPDGAFIYVGVDAGLGAFRRDALTGMLTPLEGMPREGRQFTPIAVSPDGRYVVSNAGTWNRDLSVQGGAYRGGYAPGQQPQCQSSGPGPSTCGYPLAFEISPESGLLVTGLVTERSMTTSPLDPGQGAQSYTEGRDGAQGLHSPTAFAWSPDGSYLYTAAGPWDNSFPFGGPGEGTIGVWRRTPGRPRLEQTAAFGHLVPTPPDSRSPGSISIEAGASFTNSATVSVLIRPPGSSTAIASLRLANTERFENASATRLSPDGRYAWRLEDVGLGRDVRRVHVRFTSPDDAGVSPPQDLSDDIVLDQRPPLVLGGVLEVAKPLGVRAGVSRRRGRSVLRLRARDNRSGVRRVQVTTKRARPGRKKRFGARLAVRGRPKGLWVRVFDGAGNRSRWRLVRRARRR